MNATITLREYLEKGKTFVIPNYQRGYVWGKKTKGKDLDAVSYMLEKSLIPGFNNNTPIFIQGITVTENDKEIILIDGQQRTTFFYLLLKYLGYNGKVEMTYTIRTESNDFLSTLDIDKTDFSENTLEDFQDLYFFKKTLRTIDEKLGQINKEKFCNYILNHVRFLYINILKDKATKVFSMMNGSKAEMKSEELIKAELLRLASLNDSDFDKKEEKEKNAIEWDNNMLRSRYAREWDKWLQWWNREDVKKLFKCSNVMGYLISSYLQTKDKDKDLSFDVFKNGFLHEQNPIDAKKTFDGLRRLQKRFEDAFNNPKIYNWVGAILRIGSANEFIQWFFVEDNKPSNEDLEKYYKWSFLGLTHKQIVENDENKFDDRYDELFKILESNNLYEDNSEEAFRLLLRLNIDEDNKQEDGVGRKFDFSIWDRNDAKGRSLEHIYPKSKVLHKENGIIKKGDYKPLDKLPGRTDGYIARATCRYFENGVRIEASEHSIGNLVLLYKDDNSAFNDSSFEEKKSMFFLVPDGKDKKKKMIFKSRHLLHTIYKFAQSEWKGEQIAINKYQTLKDFREYYGK
jgi:uncharacterized protein with ParB-like and HNH nuclease domain